MSEERTRGSRSPRFSNTIVKHSVLLEYSRIIRIFIYIHIHTVLQHNTILAYHTILEHIVLASGKNHLDLEIRAQGLESRGM